MNMDVDMIATTIMTEIIFLCMDGNSIKFIYLICDIYIILTAYAFRSMIAKFRKTPMFQRGEMGTFFNRKYLLST
jgi:hypothetical protein